MAKRRRAWLGGAALLIAWWLWPARRDGALVDNWQAGVHEHDYLQSLTFRDDHTGTYAFGYAQLLRFEARFRYRSVGPNRVELYDIVELDRQGRTHPYDPSTVRLDYTRRDGTFCTRHPYDGERCFARRLTVEDLPFPGSYDEYFARPL